MTTVTKTMKKHILPAASMGNERTLTVIHYGDQSAGKKAYIQAGLHADEAPGFLVMHHLIEMLERADAANTFDGQIIVVPVENRITTVQSGIEGILFSINTDRYARPGRILAKIAGKIPIKGKDENLLTL